VFYLSVTALSLFSLSIYPSEYILSLFFVEKVLLAFDKVTGEWREWIQR